MKEEIKQMIDGYEGLRQENEILRKYATDLGTSRGDVNQRINLYHPKSMNLMVSEIRKETGFTSTLRLVAENGYLPPFQAGQYINLFAEINGIRTSRPYSISSPPSQIAYYDITVRRVNGGFVSSYLMDCVQVGDRLTSTSPAGNFYYNPLFHGKALVFLAGGCGITPFMSMIREVTDRGLDRQIHLVYGSRNEDDIVFRRELSDREKRHDNLTVTHVISEPLPGYNGVTGFITESLLREQINNIERKMVYVCGPEAMYAFVLKALANLGIPRRQTRVEVFGPPDQITVQPGWPKEVKASDVFEVRFNGEHMVRAAAGEPLMNSLERFGKVIPASCRSGECSLCRTKLLKGRVYQPQSVKIRKSDKKYNYIHPCMAYPLENLELMI